MHSTKPYTSLYVCRCVPVRMCMSVRWTEPVPASAAFCVLQRISKWGSRRTIGETSTYCVPLRRWEISPAIPVDSCFSALVRGVTAVSRSDRRPGVSSRIPLVRSYRTVEEWRLHKQQNYYSETTANIGFPHAPHGERHERNEDP